MKNFSFFRRIVQTLAVLAFILMLVPLKNNPWLFHEVCPFSFFCFGPVLALNGWKIWSGILVSFAVLLFTFFAGRWFCGILCPLGALQDIIASCNTFSFLKLKKFSKVMILIRLCVFCALTFTALIAGKVLFTIFCPYIQVQIFTGTMVALICVVLILHFFVPRFFCRTLCPYGTLLSIATYTGKNLFGRYFPSIRVTNNCGGCGVCYRECPVEVLPLEGNISDLECIYCGKCIDACKKNIRSKCISFFQSEIPVSAPMTSRRAFIKGGLIIAAGSACGIGASSYSRFKKNMCKECYSTQCYPDCPLAEPREESFSRQRIFDAGKYEVKSEFCMGCTRCVSVCPVKVIDMKNNKAVIRQNSCIQCGLCYMECPVMAIFVWDENMKPVKIERKFKTYLIEQNKCTLCGMCKPVCPVNAISRNGLQYTIDKYSCIQCGKCAQLCPSKAIRFLQTTG